ncbi:hypothetical protein [Candidatus Palauibacter sp.]|uniref:hypothetical protein n=1 Tax=Candidatus Palauibacter sp. TaxID=3101350 RepID=UPI003B5B46B6
MKLIRQAAGAFALWALVTYAWAGLSHLSGVPGPARASAATLGLLADALELLDPPNAVGAPQRFAAAQIRRTAHTAESVHGAVERSTGEFLDRLGHDRAHLHVDHLVRAHERRIRVPDVHVTIEHEEQSLSLALEATELELELGAMVLKLESDASLDRDKLRKRLEKLLDLLEDLEKSKDGR